jgi:hypothetical protein
MTTLLTFLLLAGTEPAPGAAAKLASEQKDGTESDSTTVVNEPPPELSKIITSGTIGTEDKLSTPLTGADDNADTESLSGKSKKNKKSKTGKTGTSTLGK